MPTIDDIKRKNFIRIMDKILKEHDISEAEFARRLNTAPGYINRIKHGIRNLSDDMVERICKNFNINLYEFYIEDHAPVIIDDKEKHHLLKFRQAEKLGAGDEADEILDYVIQKKLRGATGGKSGAIQEGKKGQRGKKRRKTA